MPFINTKASIAITPEKEETVKARFGEAVSALGKSEGWLMVNFEDNCRLWFKGNNSAPTAFVEIALFGKASSSQYDAMTENVCRIISEELNIDSSRVYIKYEEVEHWGFNGFNF